MTYNKATDFTADQLSCLLNIAMEMQFNERDYSEIACGLPDDLMLINYGADGVWLCRMNAEEVNLKTAEKLYCVFVDPVTAVMTEDRRAPTIADQGLRFKQGVNADGGVTMTRVQQVAQYTALKLALEAMRQTGNKVAVTVEIVPFGDRALNYIITNDEGESVKLECSSTSFERLAQMAALLSK